MVTGRDFIINTCDFYYYRPRFYYERSRFAWWQVEILSWTVEIFMMTSRDFYDDFRSTEFRSVREGSILPSSLDGQLPNNVVTCLCPNHRVNSTLLVCSRWYVWHESCCCGFSGFWSKWIHRQDESRCIMVERFAVKHFSDGFLNRKMAAWVNRGTGGSFSFLGGPLDVLELRDRRRDVLKRDCGLEICKEMYSNE